MPQSLVTLIKGDTLDKNTDYRDALPVNMYSVMRPVLGADGYMLCYPGLTKMTDGRGIDRGANFNERFGEQYRVSGQRFIVVNNYGGITNVGAISGTTQAAMPYSFNTQAIITDGKMFLYDATLGLRQVTDADLGNPIDGVWVDGYYFLTDGEYIYHTDISDESSIDPLKFATAEFMPDKSLGVGKTQDNKVIVFGRYTIEYFVNAATENFAFQRVEQRGQKIGIVSTHAKCESGGKWYITGGRKDEALGVHMIGLGSAEKISTREVDKLLAKYSEPELADMRMEARTEDDTTFILVHLPQETLCFNETVAKAFGKSISWSILKTDINGNTPYRAINGVLDSNLGKWIYGDKFNGNIGRLDNTVFTHYGTAVEWILYTPFVNLERFSLDEIEIETIPGTDQNTDGTVAFSMTKDGHTFGTERFMTYGTYGDYGTRFVLRRLGGVNDWVGFKFRGATKTRMAFAGMRVTYG